MSKLPKEYCNLVFKKPVTQWDEAIPLGNGKTGCLIWGKGEALRFSLDRGDIWDNTLYPGVLEEDFTYETLVDTAKRGDVAAIREKFDAPYYNPTPTKLPAGKFIIKFNNSTNVKSELNLAYAQAKITIEKDDNDITLHSFVHATEKVGFVKFDAPIEECEIELQNPKFGIIGEQFHYGYSAEDRSVSHGSLELVKYPVAKKFNEKNFKWFSQCVDDKLEYGIILATKEVNGCTELVYSIVNSFDCENWLDDGIKNVQFLLDTGYDNCFNSHKLWWESYWNKSSVSICDKLFEKQWYLTNYLFGSCSRKFAPPMPLQGVWTADNGALPPWKGDYHNDLNTQMSYYHYLKANHIEEGESFVDFLWKLVPQAKEFAKTFFKTKGLCLPAVMTIDGKPLGGWPMYTLIPTNQMWLCQAFERHYRFTGDNEFLREKAYPYLSESAECVLSLMSENDDGKLYLPVSSSSEIHDDSLESWVTPNSNYDLSMIRYVIIQLIRLSKILNNGEEIRWQNVLDKLPQLAVNDSNVLMLSPDESLMESHRHQAHAMAIHPLRLLDNDNKNDKAVIDATVHNLEVLGTGLWVGFSFAWMAEFYAIQGNGNGAAYQLEVFWKNHCSQNGFHLNGDYKNRGTSQFHYRPFTLEANMCAADALQEMLLQTENNTISLFPAIPDEWKDEQTVEFESFRAENGLLISACMKNGVIVSLTLKPQYSGKVLLKNWNDIKNLSLNVECNITTQGNNAQLELISGNEYIFKV